MKFSPVLNDFAKAAKALPEPHKAMLLEALEGHYDVAKEKYADGSGNASPEQEAVYELMEAAGKRWGNA